MQTAAAQQQAGVPLFRRGKSGEIWYSTFRIATPSGRLAFSSLNEPNNTKFEIDEAEKNRKSPEDPLVLPAKKYRLSLMWENIDILAEKQKQYHTYLAKCKEFVKAAIPEVPEENIDYPIRKREPKNGKDIYWVLEAKAHAERKPILYHAKRKEKLERADEHYLYDGCLAFVSGNLRISKMRHSAGAGRYIDVYYVRSALEVVYHLADGERFAGEPDLTPPDLSDLGVSSDAESEQVNGEGTDNF